MRKQRLPGHSSFSQPFDGRQQAMTTKTQMPGSEQSVSPNRVAVNVLENVRPDAAHVAASIKRNFRPATLEEQIIFRKWMRGALIFYGAVALVLGGLAIANNHSSAASNGANAQTPYSIVSSANLRQQAPKPQSALPHF
jgi:hypothetical protein